MVSVRSAFGVLRSPHLLLFLATVILAANFVVVRGVYTQCPPAMLSLWRWGGGTLILLPFVWPRLRAEWPIIREHWRFLMVCGALMPVIGSLMAYLAMARTVAVNGAIIQSMIPAVVVLLTSILAIERTNLRQAAGLIVAMAGVLGVITSGDLSVLRGLSFNSGDLLLLFSVLGFAGYYVVVKRAPAKPSPIVFLTTTCAAGGLLHIPFVAAEMLRGSVMTLNMTTGLSILFVAIFPSIVVVMIYNYGLDRLGANRTSVYNYLPPAATALLAYVFLGEAIAPFHVVGTALILSGVYLTAASSPAKSVTSG